MIGKILMVLISAFALTVGSPAWACEDMYQTMGRAAKTACDTQFDGSGAAYYLVSTCYRGLLPGEL